MHVTRTLSLCSILFVTAACAETTTPGTCSPIGFKSCSGNSLVYCDGLPTAQEGTPTFTDCTATGQFCLDASFGSASCGAPVLGELCFGRNAIGCGAGDQLLRCVWVSEQPEPGVSGDVGVWRVQTDCTATGQVCRIGTSACAAP